MDAVFDFLLNGTGLEIWSFSVMCGVSFAGSFITASLSLGGGLLVMATMASLLPPTILIPLHGVVQLGSNAGRALIMRQNLLKSTIPPFLIGSVLGAVLGVNLVVTLPSEVLQTVLGCFVLYATWGPKLRANRPGSKTFLGVGFVGALATMFVGATGP